MIVTGEVVDTTVDRIVNDAKDLLQGHCLVFEFSARVRKHVSEALARVIHPNFEEAPADGR